MKTLIAVICLISLPFISMSINDPNIEQTIRNEITYPTNAKTQSIEGVVLVEFTIDQDGLVTIEQVNSNEVSLKDYVVNKLESMVFFGKKNKEQYNMKFNFKLL